WHPLMNRLTIGDVPLADAGGAIARLLQEFGNGDLLGRHRPTLAEDWLTTREERRSRGAADHLGVKAGESYPLAGQLVEPRRRKLRRAVAAEVAVALIVGENDQDV